MFKLASSTSCHFISLKRTRNSLVLAELWCYKAQRKYVNDLNKSSITTWRLSLSLNVLPVIVVKRKKWIYQTYLLMLETIISRCIFFDIIMHDFTLFEKCMYLYTSKCLLSYCKFLKIYRVGLNWK